MIKSLYWYANLDYNSMTRHELKQIEKELTTIYKDVSRMIRGIENRLDHDVIGDKL